MKTLNPFKHALRGYRCFFRTQWNAAVHTLATILVILAGAICQLSRLEWAVLAMATGLVWISELLNTSIEFVLNKLHPDWDESIGKAKDIAAAAVLCAAIVAIVCGYCIFMPYLKPWLISIDLWPFGL